MTREDTRAKLIAEGAKLIHEKGFNNTGIQEILRAAGVPKGSFYFYFQTKEEFGLAVVDYFADFMSGTMERHLNDSSLPPVGRLRRFFGEMKDYFGQEGCSRGCPIGNLAQELADLSDTFRKKLTEVLGKMQSGIAVCLLEARESGEIPLDLDPRETAYFILNSWEGALTRMKTEKTLDALIVFDLIVFGRLLCARTDKTGM
ncbi:MAG: TetR family transcriptional regulator C-terminal domain-containing protein [Pseudomonadota bacterium]